MRSVAAIGCEMLRDANLGQERNVVRQNFLRSAVVKPTVDLTATADAPSFNIGDLVGTECDCLASVPVFLQHFVAAESTARAGIPVSAFLDQQLRESEHRLQETIRLAPEAFIAASRDLLQVLRRRIAVEEARLFLLVERA